LRRPRSQRTREAQHNNVATTVRPTSESVMATKDEAPEFTDRDVRLITDSLCNAVDTGRRELLPRILAEWCRTDLRGHLQNRRTPERRRRVVAVGKRAGDLLRALTAVDKVDRAGIASEMVRAAGGIAGWAEISELIQRIEEEVVFLTKLEEAAPQTWKRGQGGPRNITAYLVMQDAAAIFEWLTNTEATREVDRDSHAEIGPFWTFVAAIWPVVFRKADDGLPAAMKNWARDRKRYGERSALIANIAMRHPTWGIFER
jgi:hypothetical protein